MKNLTQEDVAEYLRITPQSVSKWERGESYPDITLLPALTNILETSIDLLIGMDTIRAEETRYNIPKKAVAYQRNGDYDSAEKTYRDALLICPNKPGMILGLASTLALKDKTDEAIVLVRLKVVDCLYSLIRSGLTSMKLWWAFSRKSSRLRA